MANTQTYDFLIFVADMKKPLDRKSIRIRRIPKTAASLRREPPGAASCWQAEVELGDTGYLTIAMRDSIPVMLRLCHLFVVETIQKSSNLKICRYKYKERIVWSLELTLVLVTQLQKVLLHGKALSQL
ncbi:unnamed protein product [Eruca vesicaria subsp. sativa]|uniref:Uncharacterized protein n=1 Tax=Eruca vesicaria subsp. sativa TaxID=29727 RepID=A0ABC8L458_ERUVS|nr:unnamed protein product [Eruca vesicaria subsp. sativa]